MITIRAYDFKDTPYFDINIDADITGMCLVEMLRDELAKLAKEFLNDDNFEDAVKYCKTANDFQKEMDRARKILAEKETNDAETE